MQTLLRIVTLCSTAVLFACAPVAQTAGPSNHEHVATGMRQSIIVKPRQDIADGAALMKLIHARLPAYERIEYLRAMSGGAYVLMVTGKSNDSQIETIIADLMATDLFEYVELDRMMTINGRQ